MTYFEVRNCFGLVRSCGSTPEIVDCLVLSKRSYCVIADTLQL